MTVHRLVQSHDVHELVHGPGRMGKLNAALAVATTKVVGTMWCAYVFTLLALVGLPTAIQQSMSGSGPLPVVQWIAQTFLQLVLLSVILVGQNVISTAQDVRAEADHDTLTVLHQINQQQLEILQALEMRGLRAIPPAP